MWNLITYKDTCIVLSHGAVFTKYIQYLEKDYVSNKVVFHLSGGKTVNVDCATKDIVDNTYKRIMDLLQFKA